MVQPHPFVVPVSCNMHLKCTKSIHVIYIVQVRNPADFWSRNGATSTDITLARLGQDDRNIQSTAISVFGLLSDIFIILRCAESFRPHEFLVWFTLGFLP